MTHETQVKELGTFVPAPSPKLTLNEGEVGYVVTGIRDVADIKIGDTLTLFDGPAEQMLPDTKRSDPWFSVAYIHWIHLIMKS